MMRLEYRADKPMLLCRQPVTKHPMKMGIPRGDGHHFHLEEGLFLVEDGAAVITCQSRTLSLPQIYAIVGGREISHLRYGAYVHMKLTGYIVRRPKE